MIWLYTIPTWLLGSLIVGSIVILSDLGLYWFRRPIQRFAHLGNDIVFAFIGATGVIYALILGLLAVATWESLKKVEDVAQREAIQVLKLYRDLDGYPESTRVPLRAALVRYLHEVIDREWPIQQRGEKIGVSPALTELTQEWLRVEPATEGQKLVHAESLTQLNELFSCRRERVQGAEVALPAALWMVVLLGAVLNIGLTYLVATEQTAMHLLVTGMFSAMVGLMIFMLVAVDHPLWGDVSVSSQAYIDVLSVIPH